MSLGFAVSAQAQTERSNCAECNRPATKVNTSYKYKTVQRVKNVTQYKDVNRTSYQKHVNRIVNVTRIQPVTRVNVVTRCAQPHGGIAPDAARCADRDLAYANGDNRQDHPNQSSNRAPKLQLQLACDH